MRPTVDDVKEAAYDRWERRGWTHGGDRDDWLAAEKELTFHANYSTVVEAALDGPERRVLGPRAGPPLLLLRTDREPGRFRRTPADRPGPNVLAHRRGLRRVPVRLA